MAAPELGTAMRRVASDFVIPLRAFLRAIGRFLRCLRSRGGLSHHVDDDEVGQCTGRGISHLAGVTAWPHVLHRVAIRRVLRVRGPDRILFVRRQCGRHVADRRLHPRIHLLLFHHEAQELLGRLRILGVPEDHLVEEQLELARLANRPNREVGVVDVGRECGDFRILRGLSRVVDRDAVIGQ